MSIFIILLALVVIIANAYAGWLGFPVWQSIAAFALVHTIFRLGKRFIINSSDHDKTDKNTQLAQDNTALPNSETQEGDDVDIPLFVSMTSIYVVMLLVAAFWYSVGYIFSKLFG